jgi:hypothetical protein
MSQQTSREAPRRRGRSGIPPLVWIVLALVVAAIAWAVSQRSGTLVTPHGGTHPTQAEGPSVMPPTPPSGDAPGTPGSVGPGTSPPR